MKKLILNTKDGISDADRKSFQYYLNEPIILNEKSVIKTQAISCEPYEGVTYTEGLLNQLYLNVDQSSFSQSSFDNVYAQYYIVNLNTETDYSGAGRDAKIDFAVFRDWGATNNDPPYRVEVSALYNNGYGYVAGETFNVPVFEIGGSGTDNVTITITQVVNNQPEVDDYGKITSESHFDFDEDYYEYSAGIPGIVSYYNIDLNNGLRINCGVNAAREAYCNDILLEGHSFLVGTVFWLNKNRIYYDRSSSSGYYTPQKVTVTAVSQYVGGNTGTHQFYNIKLRGLDNDSYNIMTTDKSNDVLLYNKRLIDFENISKTDYKVATLEPQIIQNLQLVIETDDGFGLPVNGDLTIDLKISP